jgi:hypothetical protein
MSNIRNIAMAGMLAFATAAPVAAEAAPMMNAPVQVSKNTDVTSVRCWNCRGWRGGYRYGWRGRYWGGPRRYWGPGYWGPRIVIGPTVVVRPRAYWAWCGPRWHRYRCLVRY